MPCNVLLDGSRYSLFFDDRTHDFLVCSADIIIAKPCNTIPNVLASTPNENNQITL